MVTKNGKAPPAGKPAAAAAKKPKAPPAAARKVRAAPAKKPAPTATAKVKAVAVKAELALEALARGVLDNAIRPGVKDVRRLAEAVAEVFDKRANKKKGGGKKKTGKKKLAKIAGQKAKK
jgi:hypothetical protein